MTRGTRQRLVLALSLVAVACGKKEEPPRPTPKPAPTTLAPVVTTTTLPAPTAVPTPVPVWRTLRWGMKKPEVLAALPGEAQKLPKPAEFDQPQPGSRLTPGSGDVSIPGYDADGAKFRVLFGIDGSGLKRIHLTALKPSAATCPDLESALTSRHGAPTQRATTGTTLKGQELVWTLPDQTIVLDCAGVAKLGFVTVTLDYLSPETPAPK